MDQGDCLLADGCVGAAALGEEEEDDEDVANSRLVVFRWGGVSLLSPEESKGSVTKAISSSPRSLSAKFMAVLMVVVIGVGVSSKGDLNGAAISGEMLLLGGLL